MAPRRTEKEHVVPKYAGGTDDPDNIMNVEPDDHAFKHLLGALFPEPEQDQNAEYWASHAVNKRMDLGESIGYTNKLLHLGAEMGHEEIDKATSIIARKVKRK